MLEDMWVEDMPWPPKGQNDRLQDLAHYNMLFEGDPATLKAWVRRLQREGQNEEQPLNEWVTFPAPEIAARTLSSFLFGESALITSDTAQDEVDALVEANYLHALNQEAALTCAVEGEVYYKIDWDKEVSDQAIIQAMSANKSFPLFRYGRMAEVVFCWELERKGEQVVRQVEIRLPGVILNRVFKGTDTKLGVEITFEDYPDTEGMLELVDTGFERELLARYAPFWRTTRSPHGISIFRGKDGLIEGMHTLYTQDQHDAEMSKRRVAIASNYLSRDAQGRPKWDRNMDLFELSDEAAGAIGGDTKPLHAIEFTDSTIMGQRIAQRFDEFLLACGIAPQSAGRDVSGSAESGTARKLAQSLTLQTVATAARYFKPCVRDIVGLGLAVTAKHLGGTAVAAPEIQVAMQDGFVNDAKEMGEVMANLTTSQSASTQTRVRMLHPEWSDDAVMEEVGRIKEEAGLVLPDPLANEGGFPNDEEDGQDDA